MYSKVTSQTAGPREKYLPALDGLRFMAAMLVAGGHYASIFSKGTASGTITTLTGLGMTLFFVLSSSTTSSHRGASRSAALLLRFMRRRWRS